jgi:hypothetical protein
MKYKTKTTCLVALAALLAAMATASAQVAVPASFAHPAGSVNTGTKGFKVRTVQATTASGGLDNSVARAEAQLLGTLKDPITKAPYSDVSDKTLFGPDGYYVEPTVIDYEQGGASANGLTIPGIPGADDNRDNIALEALTFLDLKAGDYTMTVNSDDGFRVTVGSDARDQAGAIELGVFDGGRGAGNTAFKFSISQAGVYSFRLVYFEGTGGANVSWYMGEGDTKVLINDSGDPSSMKAYREITSPAAPYFLSLNPRPNATKIYPNATVDAILVDTSVTVDPASIQLFYDGAKVAVTPQKTAGKTAFSYDPPGLLEPLSKHSVKIVFNDSANNSRTVEYGFTTAEFGNITLPNPFFFENFDSTKEGVVPAGWVVKNFSDGDDGDDLDNVNSGSYKNWVVISKERAISIGSRRGNTPPLFVNGQQIASLINGNFFYAESDNRGGSQVQYLFSPDIDCSAQKNVHLSFHNIYEQNQDSLGAVEYSVDKGATWLPVAYYIDVPDIINDASGKVDGYATLIEPRSDTAHLTDPVTGEEIGLHYGAFIGVTSNKWSQIGPFISGRINDDPTESKRVELYPLPEADGKATVRLRFAQAGTGSWYFGIDDFGLYGTKPSVEPPPTPGGGSKTLVTEDFESVDTAGLVAKGWILGKNEFALEDGSDFVVAPPYAKATEENPALPGSDFVDAAGVKLVNPPGERGIASTGKYLISDSDTAGGSDNIDSKSEFWAITPAFSTVGASEVWFHADAEIDNNNNGECVVELAASIDDGKTWIPAWQAVEPQRVEKSVSTYGDYRTGGERTGGYPEFGSASQTKTWDGIHGRWHVKLPAAALNQPKVRVRIEYFEPADAWWIALDNVVIDNNPPPQGKDVVLSEAFESGIPAAWKKGSKKGQNWGTEPLKDAEGKFLLKQTESDVPTPINLDIVREAAARGVAKADILDPTKNTAFDQVNPNGGGFDGKWLMMLAGGNYALWQEGQDVEEQSTLDTPALNLTDADAVFIDFDSEIVQRNGSAVNEVFVSADNGATFQRIFTYNDALGNRGEAPYFMKHYIAVPEAAKKNNVIFRFSATGGDPDRNQGFWAIDNVRITANKASVTKPTLAISSAAGKITITYTGTLQGADAVAGPYTDVAGAASPLAVTPSAAAKFYRAR